MSATQRKTCTQRMLSLAGDQRELELQNQNRKWLQAKPYFIPWSPAGAGKISMVFIATTLLHFTSRICEFAPPEQTPRRDIWQLPPEPKCSKEQNLTQRNLSFTLFRFLIFGAKNRVTLWDWRTVAFSLVRRQFITVPTHALKRSRDVVADLVAIRPVQTLINVWNRQRRVNNVDKNSPLRKGKGSWYSKASTFCQWTFSPTRSYSFSVLFSQDLLQNVFPVKLQANFLPSQDLPSGFSMYPCGHSHLKWQRWIHQPVVLLACRMFHDLSVMQANPPQGMSDLLSTVLLVRVRVSPPVSFNPSHGDLNLDPLRLSPPKLFSFLLIIPEWTTLEMFGHEAWNRELLVRFAPCFSVAMASLLYSYGKPSESAGNALTSVRFPRRHCQIWCEVHRSQTCKMRLCWCNILHSPRCRTWCTHSDLEMKQFMEGAVCVHTRKKECPCGCFQVVVCLLHLIFLSTCGAVRLWKCWKNTYASPHVQIQRVSVWTLALVRPSGVDALVAATAVVLLTLVYVCKMGLYKADQLTWMCAARNSHCHSAFSFAIALMRIFDLKTRSPRDGTELIVSPFWNLMMAESNTSVLVKVLKCRQIQNSPNYSWHLEVKSTHAIYSGFSSKFQKGKIYCCDCKWNKRFPCLRSTSKLVPVKFMVMYCCVVVCIQKSSE